MFAQGTLLVFNLDHLRSAHPTPGAPPIYSTQPTQIPPIYPAQPLQPQVYYVDSKQPVQPLQVTYSAI
jgi:hypothetical protein